MVSEAEEAVDDSGNTPSAAPRSANIHGGRMDGGVVCFD